jgi:hypothetical protein
VKLVELLSQIPLALPCDIGRFRDFGETVEAVTSLAFLGFFAASLDAARSLGPIMSAKDANLSGREGVWQRAARLSPSRQQRKASKISPIAPA